jgi:hypothetical protein
MFSCSHQMLLQLWVLVKASILQLLLLHCPEA